MAYKARWGPMGFLVSPTKIVPFEDFKSSITLKTDNGNDSKNSATNSRGLELQSMTFSTTYIMAAGVDPRERLAAWGELVGDVNPLYIGSKRFGPSDMQLTKVDIADLVTSDKGDFLSLTLNITLQEKTQKTTKASSSSSKKGKSNSSKAASTYQKTVEKKKAMQATAATDERNRKKVTAMEKRLG